jgi:DNA adenine methylase
MTFPESMNSPFRYAGGKFYARKLILAEMPEHEYYCEPFAGGGSIFFAKSKAEESWLNDIDQDLVNTFIHIRDFPKELASAVSSEPATKERHHYFKNIFSPTNDLERAIRWYYLNRTSYSGIMNMANCYWGYGEKYSMRPENWTRNILRTSHKLQDVKITGMDFVDVINAAKDGSFLFVDPPYFNADQDKFYTHSFQSDDHTRLMEALKSNSARLDFLVTYDNCQPISDMYNWVARQQPAEWNYTIARTDDQKKSNVDKDKVKGFRTKGKELFIMNYED